MFLLLFSGYLLFDYYPESVVASTVINTERIKVTITELLVIIFVFIYLIDEIREVPNATIQNQKNMIIITFLTYLLKLVSINNSDKAILSKVRTYYSNKWNIFDTFTFLLYFLGFFIRFSPIVGTIFWIRDDNAYEIARFLYKTLI